MNGDGDEVHYLADIDVDDPQVACGDRVARPWRRDLLLVRDAAGAGL